MSAKTVPTRRIHKLRQPRVHRPASASGSRSWATCAARVRGRHGDRARPLHDPRRGHRHRSPAGILRWLNAAMLRQRAGRFVTLARVRLHSRRRSVSVTASCGGHPCPMILRATGLVEELGAHGTVLGVLEDVELARPQRPAHARRRADSLHRRADRGRRPGRVDAGPARRRDRRRAPHERAGHRRAPGRADAPERCATTWHCSR